MRAPADFAYNILYECFTYRDQFGVTTKPLLISVTGAHSGSGKTTFAVKLLEKLAGKWGAIKYTKTSFYSSITDSPEIIDQKNKDTYRLSGAGAEMVLWVQSPLEGLKEIIEKALTKFSGIVGLEGIIIEGNSPSLLLTPDIVAFVYGEDKSKVKESSRSILDKASIKVYRDNFNDSLEVVMDEIKSLKIKERLLDNSTDNRIPCAIARALAEEFHVPYKEVGDLANTLKIKVKSCELGCF